MLYCLKISSSFLLRQDELGAINWLLVINFFKGPGANFQDQEPFQNSRNIYFSIFCTKQGYGPTTMHECNC